MKHFLRAQMQRWPFEELAEWSERCGCPGGSSSPAWSSRGSARSPTASSPNRPGRSSPGRRCTPTCTRGARDRHLRPAAVHARPAIPACRWWRAPAGSPTPWRPRRVGTGVEILTGRRVGRIVVERGRAVAVEAGGDTVSARRAVICALEVELVRLAGPESFAQGPGRDPLLPARPRHLQGRLGARRSGAVGGRGVPAGRGGPRGRLGDRHEPLRLGGRPASCRASRP